MINLLIFILVIYGASNMLVHSAGPLHIFEHYRSFMHKLPSNIGEGSECMICTPCQLSIIFSIVNVLLVPNITITPSYYLINDLNYWWVIIPMDGALGSGCAWVLHNIEEWFEYSVNKE